MLFRSSALLSLHPSLVVLMVVLCAGSARAEPTTQEILRYADGARGNLQGVEWEVSVASREKDRTTEVVYQVQARGFDVLATATAPPKDKGNKLLMVKGSMWFYKPGLSKPVPISQRQKLAGLACYGDIASTNYVSDYEATLKGEDIVNNEPCSVYELKAKSSQVTYDLITYWISKQRLVGIKAEYFTVSGKMIKRSAMEYNNEVEIDGKKYPFISRIVINDVLLSSNVTQLTFSRPVFREIPDHVYNLNLLTR